MLKENLEQYVNESLVELLPRPGIDYVVTVIDNNGKAHASIKAKTNLGVAFLKAVESDLSIALKRYEQASGATKAT